MTAPTHGGEGGTIAARGRRRANLAGCLMAALVAIVAGFVLASTPGPGPVPVESPRPTPWCAGGR